MAIAEASPFVMPERRPIHVMPEPAVRRQAAVSLGDPFVAEFLSEAARVRDRALVAWRLALDLASAPDLAWWSAEDAAWLAYRHAANLWRLACDLRDAETSRARHYARQAAVI